MACPEFEPRILDLVDRPDAIADREAVRAHLAACPACQAFASELQRLDVALQRAVEAPQLSPDFDTRLWQRIAAEAPTIPEAERAAKKRALEAEFAERTRALRRAANWWIAGLDGLGLGVLLSLLAYGGWRWLPRFLEQVSTLSWTANQTLLAASASAGIVVLGAIAATVWRPMRRLGIGL